MAAQSTAIASSATPAVAAAPVDDGTVVLTEALDDDTGVSIVGEGQLAEEVEETPAARPRKATRVRVARAETPKAAAPAAAPREKAAAAPPAKAAPNPMLAQAKTVYAGRCVPCHGAQGRGDGPAGGALTPKPRNFHDKTWQAKVTDLHIEKVILQGGPSVGKSPLMPPHADLGKNPQLISAMREVVRGFGR
ncbi:MAG: hypothetical protein R3B48_29545 [Kofleriaceae bacterium]